MKSLPSPMEESRLKKSSQSELVHWVSSYPYLFITQGDLLIWHGNSTYPKKDFEVFLLSWEEGGWTKEAVSKKNSVDSRNIEKIKTLTKKKSGVRAFDWRATV